MNTNSIKHCIALVIFVWNSQYAIYFRLFMKEVTVIVFLKILMVKYKIMKNTKA